MTIRTAILQGTKLFEDASVSAPRLTAEVLICHALRCERSYLYAHPEEELTEVAWIHYGRYLHERLKGKPTQYITGRQEFYGRDFRVTPAVLIPRPETEHLIAAALRVIEPVDRVLDIGTGSGAIAITLALESGARVFASDISLAALEIAAGNSRSLCSQVAFFAADLTASLSAQSLDVLVSNPPYVPRTDEPGLQQEVRDYEPHLALFAGNTGLDVYERLIADARRVLRPGGRLVLELGYNSLEPVKKILDSGWNDITVEHDLAGIARVITAALDKLPTKK